MSHMRIAVSGASGLIGSALVPALEAAGHDVVRLIRGRQAGQGELAWDPDVGAIDAAALAGIDGAVHLSGATIGRRWTAARKTEILDSRVRSTRLLAETLASLDPRPAVLVCAGGIGIYGDRGAGTRCRDPGGRIPPGDRALRSGRRAPEDADPVQARPRRTRR